MSHFNSSRRSPRGCPVEASSFAHGDRRSQVRQSASGSRCMSSNEPHCCSDGSFVWAIETATAWRKETHFRTKTCKPAQKKALENVCDRGSAWSGPSPPASSARSHLGPIDVPPAGCRSCQAEVPAFVDRDFAAAPEKLGLLPKRTPRTLHRPQLCFIAPSTPKR